MNIVSTNQKEEWDQFIIENNGSFLQSWSWGKFQESLGRRIWRLETEGLKALLIKYNLPLKKNYLYCPRGPIGPIKAFLEKVKEIGQKEKSIFFKIESDNRDSPLGTVLGTRTVPKGLSLFKSTKEIQPTKTLVLDISKPEEELLSQIHSKTRYNIRLARKKGVTIEESNEKIDDFLRLSKETAKRDRFHLHPQGYYQKMLEVLGQERMIKLFLAKYQNKIIAANLICFFGQTATYLHGASDYNSRQLMAPHLLQWQAICQAKKLGLRYYDFWGIDEKKWPGVTRFKKGFSGQEITFPGAFDLIFQPTWYRIYNLARKVL